MGSLILFRGVLHEDFGGAKCGPKFYKEGCYLLSFILLRGVLYMGLSFCLEGSNMGL